MLEPGTFVPGLELSRILYHEAVRPILARRFPNLVYSAGRVDAGSDVLGFDTPRSMDHDWGPRLTLFLPEATYSPALAEHIRRALGDELPFTIGGFPTHFTRPEGGNSLLTLTDQRPINHGVEVTTLRAACRGWLGIELDQSGELSLRLEEWLTVPEQELRAFTAGAVFRDDTGELERARAMLRWYPHDVWLYLLAAGWRRIEQEEPFMGRCGQVGGLNRRSRSPLGYAAARALPFGAGRTDFGLIGQPEQPQYRHIFVQIGPVDAIPLINQLVTLQFFRRGVGQPREPL